MYFFYSLPANVSTSFQQVNTDILLSKLLYTVNLKESVKIQSEPNTKSVLSRNNLYSFIFKCYNLNKYVWHIKNMTQIFHPNKFAFRQTHISKTE